MGDYSRARKEYGEALALYQKVGEQQGISSSYGNLGWVYSLEGNLTEAVKNEESAIAIKRQTKSKIELDLWLGNLADVLVSKGDVSGAQKYLDEGFEVNAQTQNKTYSMYLHAVPRETPVRSRSLRGVATRGGAGAQGQPGTQPGDRDGTKAAHVGPVGCRRKPPAGCSGDAA